MLSPRIVRPLLLAAAMSLAGCKTHTQSAVDVPVTLDAVRALHHPPDVVVEVARKERHMGGGGCGHSALCVLLIPVIAYDAVFPETWDEAIVTDHGAVTYEGRFRKNGELIEAKAKKDGVARLITVLPLDRLKRRVVVEGARAALGADGKEGEYVKTKIVPQVDLPAAYKAALASEKDEEDRADDLVEAATWLDDEALPLLREVLPGESDVTAARVLEKSCGRPDDAHGKAVRAEVMGMLGKKPGPKTAAQGLSCAVGSRDAKAALPFVEALGAQICEDGDDRAARQAAEAFGDAGRSFNAASSEETLRAARRALGSRAPRCTSPERRVLLELHAGLEPSPADLESALASEALGDDIVRLVFADRPQNRAAIFAALPRRKSDGALIRALDAVQISPTGPELTTLAEVYPRNGTILGRGARDAQIVGLFGRAKGDAALTAGARRSIEAAVISAAPADRPRLRAALLALGDKAQALPASRGLAGLSKIARASADQEPIIRALGIAGCKDEEILAAARKAPDVKDEDRGALCAR
ncbi:MAG: hypothetical protein U0359_08415 [Byssovorax sp.]